MTDEQLVEHPGGRWLAGGAGDQVCIYFLFFNGLSKGPTVAMKCLMKSSVVNLMFGIDRGPQITLETPFFHPGKVQI